MYVELSMKIGSEPMGFAYSLTAIVVLLYCTGIGIAGVNKYVNETKNGVTSLAENEVKFVTIKASPLDIEYFYNITTPWSFVIIQSHSQYRNVSLSTQYNSEIYTSSSTAIFKSLSYDGASSSAGHNEGLHSLGYALAPTTIGSSFKTLLTGVTYAGRSPIPGGCCLTCSLEVDPNLVINAKHYYKSILTFSPANVYDYESSSCSGTRWTNPRHYRLKYSVYQYFLEEGSLGDDELFDGLTKMLTPAAVKLHGKKIHTWDPKQGTPSLSFDTPRGQGILFNILVHDPLTNADVVYSPVVTYGCSFTAKVDGCDSMGAIINIILAICVALLGLCICLFGHRLYHLYIILNCSTLFAFFGFILLTNSTEWGHTVRMVGSLVIGLVCGSLVYLFWWTTKYRYIVLYICGLTLGFLVAAVLFFTPFGDLKYWKNDVNYWTVIFCTSFTVPIVFLLSLKVFVIVVSTIVGAYGFVVGVDMFVHSSLSYIILDILVRAIENDFQRYDVPFQRKDYILSAVWVVLAILGAVVQYRVSRGQTTLRPPPRRPKVEDTRPSLPDQRNIQTGRTSHGPRNSHLFRPHSNIYQTDAGDHDDERLPILVDSKPPMLYTENPNNQRNTRYGTNIVC